MELITVETGELVAMLDEPHPAPIAITTDSNSSVNNPGRDNRDTYVNLIHIVTIYFSYETDDRPNFEIPHSYLSLFQVQSFRW